MSRGIPTPSPTPLPHLDAVAIRPAYPEDAAALERLARLDSQRPLTGRLLIAERDGRPLAALAPETGRVIADPFAPTADLVALLRVRGAATARAGAHGDRRRWRTGASLRRPPALARG